MFAALEKILTDLAAEAAKRAERAIHALKTATESVRHHSEQLKKAMDDADVSRAQLSSFSFF